MLMMIVLGVLVKGRVCVGGYDTANEGDGRVCGGVVGCDGGDDSVVCGVGCVYVFDMIRLGCWYMRGWCVCIVVSVMWMLLYMFAVNMLVWRLAMLVMSMVYALLMHVVISTLVLLSDVALFAMLCMRCGDAGGGNEDGYRQRVAVVCGCVRVGVLS